MKLSKLKKCNNNDIVCVDFFDTIVTRKHSPNYSALMWCRRIVECFGLDIDLNTMLYLRKSIIEVCDRTYKESLTLFVNYLKEYKAYNIDANLFYKKAKEFDYEIELEEIVLNKSLIKKLKQTKNKGCKIFIVSDFYFEKDFYLKAVEKFSVSGLFDEIFVSSEMGKTKQAGSLYKYLKQTYNQYNLIMIGDNEYADSYMSRINDFSSIYYNTTNTKLNRVRYKLRDLKYDKLSIKSYAKIFNQKNSMGGVSNYSFSLYDMCERLYKFAVKNNINKLYFLAREGQFLKKLFEEYQTNRAHQVECKYLYINRLSTFLPSLYDKEISKEVFYNLTKTYNNISLKKFLINCQFSNEEIKKLSLNDVDKKLYGFADSEEFKQLLKNKKFNSILKTKIEKSYLEFINYYNKITNNEENVCLVDVGWKGTMQDNLSFMFPQKRYLGLYLGLNSINEINSNNKKVGMLWDVAQNPYYIDFVNFEYILKADHGKVQYYKEGEPVLVDDGDVVAYKNLVKILQDDMFEKFKLIKIARQNDITYLRKNSVLINNHKKMLRKANMKFIKTLYKIWLYHDENFGDITDNSGATSQIKFLKSYLSKKRAYFINTKFKYSRFD